MQRSIATRFSVDNYVHWNGLQIKLRKMNLPWDQKQTNPQRPGTWLKRHSTGDVFSFGLKRAGFGVVLRLALAMCSHVREAWMEKEHVIVPFLSSPLPDPVFACLLLPCRLWNIDKERSKTDDQDEEPLDIEIDELTCIFKLTSLLKSICICGASSSCPCDWALFRLIVSDD